MAKEPSFFFYQRFRKLSFPDTKNIWPATQPWLHSDTFPVRKSPNCTAILQFNFEILYYGSHCWDCNVSGYNRTGFRKPSSWPAYKRENVFKTVANIWPEMQLLYNNNRENATLIDCSHSNKKVETTVFENHTKSLIQHCERSELRLFEQSVN